MRKPRPPRPVDPLSLPLAPDVLASVDARGTRWPDGRAAMWRELRRGPDGKVIPVKRLARMAGLASSTLDRFERADHIPRLQTGLKIARAIGISPWRVLDYHLARRAYDKIHGIEDSYASRRRRSRRWHVSPVPAAESPLDSPDSGHAAPLPRDES